jgi:hypothetical protein
MFIYFLYFGGEILPLGGPKKMKQLESHKSFCWEKMAKVAIF